MKKHNHFYTILGVEPSATQEQIKAAYRAKALKTHPDRNPNNPKKEEEFKEITSAYETLSNPEKRTEYDLLQNPPVHPFPVGFPTNEFFSHKWSTQQARNRSERVHAGDLKVGMGETLSEQIRDVETSIRASCTKCVGLGMRGMEDSCSGCDGRGWNFTDRSFQVKIPAGVFDGYTVSTRIPGVGELQTKVVLDIPENIKLGPSGKVVMSLDIPYHLAVLGGPLKLDLFDGSSVTVKVPPLKKPKQMLKLAGKGLVVQPGGKTRGDLFLSFGIDYPPATMSEEYKTTVQKLATLYSQEQENK